MPNPYSGAEPPFNLSPNYTSCRTLYEAEASRKQLANNSKYLAKSPAFFFSRTGIYEILNIPVLSRKDPSSEIVKGIVFRLGKESSNIILIASPSDEEGSPFGVEEKNIKNGINKIGSYINNTAANNLVNDYNRGLQISLEAPTSSFVYLEEQLMDLLGHAPSTSKAECSFQIIMALDTPGPLPDPPIISNLFFSLGFKDGTGTNTREYRSFNCPPRCY